MQPSNDRDPKVKRRSPLGSWVLLGLLAPLPFLVSCDSDATGVTPVVTLEVAPSEGSALVGGTLQLVASARAADGDILADRTVAWTSADESLATVSESGLVAGMAEGTTIITATIEGVSGTATVVVLPAPTATVEVSPSPASVMVGMTMTLTATPRDAGGNELSGRTVAWTSDDEGVAAVDALGRVKGRSLGSATITATVEGRSDAATVTVTPFGVSSLSPGAWHTCGVAAGEAFCWGSSFFGELGTGVFGEDMRPIPTRVVGGLTFASVSTGRLHTCGLTADGTAYCWGKGDSHLLGGGSDLAMSAPLEVLGGLTFASLTAGVDHTCALTPDGEAYCWGSGALGNGSGGPSDLPTAVTGGLRFGMISAGDGHTCGVTEAGAVYCWGSNGWGKLGQGTLPTYWVVPARVPTDLTFTAISAGYEHTCGITTEGTAYCWGKNRSGQLGDGTEDERFSPTLVSGGLTFASLSAGDDFTCGLTPGGKAYCWGENSMGQLGDGSVESRLVPSPVAGGLAFAEVVAGEHHACGSTTSGATYCWGSGIFSQLGIGSVGNFEVPTQVSPPLDPTP